MATMGLVSLAKPDEKTVLLTEATNEEWMGYKNTAPILKGSYDPLGAFT